MNTLELLLRLASGEFDGLISESEKNGVSWGYYIEKGIPVKYKEGRSSKFFDGKENVRSPGKVEKVYFDTDKKKIIFFQKYGFLQALFKNHPDIIEYSNEYYHQMNDK